MDRKLIHYFNLLERRVSAFRMLAAGLEASCSALSELDLDTIHKSIAEQEHLCTEIRFLDDEMGRILEPMPENTASELVSGRLDSLEEQLGAEESKRFYRLCSELEEAHKEVRHRNRVHTSLLRRSRRSVNVLMNFLTNLSQTHGPSSAGGTPSRVPLTLRV